jgi:CheY-like chemotaxis protein
VSPVSDARSTPLRVLIGDDHEDSALSLALVLESAGCEVRTAGNGEDALQAAMDYRPDAILLDIGMPKLDGYEVCRMIRAAEQLPQRTLILALTGRGLDDDKRKSAEAGFDRHLVKPIDPQNLIGILRSVGTG